MVKKVEKQWKWPVFGHFHVFLRENHHFWHFLCQKCLILRLKTFENPVSARTPASWYFGHILKAVRSQKWPSGPNQKCLSLFLTLLNRPTVALATVFRFFDIIKNTKPIFEASFNRGFLWNLTPGGCQISCSVPHWCSSVARSVTWKCHFWPMWSWRA